MRRNKRLKRKYRRYRRLIKRIIFLFLIVLSVKGVKKFKPISQSAIGIDDSIKVGELRSHIKTEKELEKLEKNIDRFSQKQRSLLKDILDNRDNYSESLINLALSNPEALDFVHNYPNREKFLNQAVIDTDSSIELNRGYPLYLQWDKRWGYKSYGDNIIALAGCAPTSLSMAVSGLNGDNRVTPDQMARISMDGDFITEENFTKWSFMTEGCKEFGITGREIPLDESMIKKEISKGNPLIFSMSEGIFTEVGHMILITGVDDKGDFIINDSNSIERSKRTWSYDEIHDQIRNIWSYSK